MHNTTNYLPDVRFMASGSKIQKFQNSGTFQDWKRANWDSETSREQKQYDRLNAKLTIHGNDSYVGNRANKKLNALHEANPNLIDNSENMNFASRTRFAGANFKAGTSNIIGKAADTAAGAITSVAGSKVDTNETQQMVKNAITKGISMIPGWGTPAGALKITNAIGDATGTNLDYMNKSQANGINISGWAKMGNDILSSLPIPFLGAATGDTMNAYNTKDVAELSDAYGGTSYDVNLANSMGGKSYVFGKKQANNFINTQNRNVDLLTSINQTDSLRKRATGENFAHRNEAAFSGRSMASDMAYVGKQGLKLMSREEARQMIYDNTFKKEIIKQFQNGGVIGVDSNILPEGALHKNLNHLEDVNQEVGEEVTVKGIPVIVTDENCNIKQVAEIEKEEIILRKDLTKKIESLWKDGSEQAMILAGKLLANEIITNTQDNTGQIEELNNEQK